MEELNLKKHFPILSRDKDFIYLDSAASSQKPLSVINEVSNFYLTSYANIHRGVYPLSEKASMLYEEGRKEVSKFLNSTSTSQIIFTKGATEGLNLVAYSYILNSLKEGDEIVISIAEHHSNFVPWQQIAKLKGLNLKIVELDKNEEFSIDLFKKAITKKTKFLSITHLSNVLGIFSPLKEIISLTHKVGGVVMVDASQSVSHVGIDVKELDLDFLVFSAHKIYAPSGVGVLYAKEELLNLMSPFQYGGDMISRVEIEDTKFNSLPYKFEAGTPNIEGVIGLKEAIKFYQSIDNKLLIEHEKNLINLLKEELKSVNGLRIFSPNANHTALVSFIVENVHSLDLAEYLAANKIAIRVGHHCAEPLMTYLGVNSTIRVSLGLYNTASDIKTFLITLKKAISFFKG